MYKFCVYSFPERACSNSVLAIVAPLSSSRARPLPVRGKFRLGKKLRRTASCAERPASNESKLERSPSNYPTLSPPYISPVAFIIKNSHTSLRSTDTRDDSNAFSLFAL